MVETQAAPTDKEFRKAKEKLLDLLVKHLSDHVPDDAAEQMAKDDLLEGLNDWQFELSMEEYG